MSLQQLQSCRHLRIPTPTSSQEQEQEQPALSVRHYLSEVEKGRLPPVIKIGLQIDMTIIIHHQFDI
jgi:hypothetical protein